MCQHSCQITHSQRLLQAMLCKKDHPIGQAIGQPHEYALGQAHLTFQSCLKCGRGVPTHPKRCLRKIILKHLFNTSGFHIKPYNYRCFMVKEGHLNSLRKIWYCGYLTPKHLFYSGWCILFICLRKFPPK